MNGFVLIENVPDFDFHYRNLSRSFMSLFSIPMKLFSRMSKIDEQDVLVRQALEHHDAGVTLEQAVEREFTRQFEVESKSLVGLPGIFSFMLSGYALGLLIMALLLNRMQNLVIPSRPHFTAHVRRSQSFFRQIWAVFLPLDISSSPARLSLRLPSLYLLARSLLLMSITLLQTSDMFPNTNWTWLRPLGHWAAEKSMSDICWSTFGSVCVAIAIGQLTAGLEGSPTNSSSFNMFGYSFLLHMYSSPSTHVVTTRLATSYPSRPDKHVIITMFLPLLQLAIIHFLGIRKMWSRERLIPTTICGMLSLLHFHYILFVSPALYPLINYLPALLESFLLIITAMTVSLNALTQLLLEGTVTRPLFGSSESHQMNLFGVHPSAMPKADEDFSVAILRLGVASFEATGVAGLGNEVSPVSKPTVSLNREGVKHFNAIPKGVTGFYNDITNVEANPPLGEEEAYVNNPWVIEGRRYLVCVAKVIRGCWQWAIVHLSRRQPRAPPAQAPERSNLGVSGSSGMVAPSREQSSDQEDTVYERFLRGRSLSDDDDDSYEPSRLVSRANTPSISDDDGEEEALHIPTNDGAGNAAEVINLYSDITSTVIPARPSTPLLVAHLASSSMPLTRARYNAMIASSEPNPQLGEDQLREFPVGRGQAPPSPKHDRDDGANRNCVVCTVEPRDVICWPCRCLALCDDCRANLASRSAAYKHSCPCCRNSVQGYSRIFIP